ncbi:MAG TPA: ubiquinol oxidase subunit II [Candidatus Saccharimonadales bacterium]|nr:ubiquinol oxidase subunit II [Candidatus Saccharimonadales bacterium]
MALILITVMIGYFKQADVQVLEPAGTIGEKQRNLIYFALGLSLIVVIPVYVMLFAFAWRYREGNKKAKYSPELSGNRVAEAVWWIIPTILITILSVVAWNSSHDLDPYKPIDSRNKPLKIQVVAMNWKWLFIYPEQKVASVNFLQFPKDTPLEFQITSDGPMNSFWIPRLGGQVYAMAGMMTRLHLIASETGVFRGSSANLSGDGFSRMTFKAKSGSPADFDAWMKRVKSSGVDLDDTAYRRLASPGVSSVKYYSQVKGDLFAAQIHKFMVPSDDAEVDYSSLPAVHEHDHGGGGHGL